jgi:hypothetical protein
VVKRQIEPRKEQDMWSHAWYDLQEWFGVTNLSGRSYGFWSGVGSDIGELTLFGILWATLRKHNCEVHGCFRMGRHKTLAGHSVCRKHHPDDKLTAQAVVDAHNEALKS